jgi:hypothetical protein
MQTKGSTNRLRKLAATLALMVLLCAACFGATIAFRYYHRPLFHSTFSVHGGILPRWWPFPFPIVDKRGNMALVDEPSNLLVVIATGQPGYQGQKVPVTEGDHASLDLDTSPPITIDIPKDVDSLIIYRNGSPPARIRLDGGEAIKIFNSIQTATDIMDLAIVRSKALPNTTQVVSP